LRKPIVATFSNQGDRQLFAILLKNPLSLLSLVWFRPLADEPEFVTVIDFPFDDFPWFDVDGGGQWEW
jgi:hypothetical protein